MKNLQIYEYNKNLSIFKDFNIKLPVKISFYLQKNIQLIQQAATDIEKARLGIGQKFGQMNDACTGYDIPAENLEEANKELADLFDLEQDINIHKFKIEEFDNIELSYQELSAIMFMIEE